MTTKIYSKVTSKGIHSFYLSCNEGNFFLFCQNYRRGVSEHFGGGLTLNDALDVTKGKGNTAIVRTIRKLPIYIRYIEKEYGICILSKTKRKERKKRPQEAA